MLNNPLISKGIRGCVSRRRTLCFLQNKSKFDLLGYRISIKNEDTTSVSRVVSPVGPSSQIPTTSGVLTGLGHEKTPERISSVAGTLWGLSLFD